MPRRLFTLAAAVSLVMCVATAVLSIRSRGRIEGWERLAVDVDRGFMRADVFAVNDGELTFFRWTITYEPVAAQSGSPFPYVPHGLRHFEERVPRDFGFGRATFWERVGFRLSRERDAPFRTRCLVTVPLWALMAAFALQPIFLLCRTIRRRHRCNAARCPRCGYDLRATPGRCPECGTVPAAPEPAG